MKKALLLFAALLRGAGQVPSPKIKEDKQKK